MVRIIVGFCLYWFCQNAMALTSVSATVDKNPVVVKESFLLKVIADDDVNSNALDTSALLKDFVVGRTSVSSQTSIVNFNTKKTTTWTTILIAKKSGAFVIPSFNIEGNTTQAIKLKVLEESDPNANTQQDIFITSDVSNNSVYVQQQLTLTVKLHFATELKRGSLTEPSLPGASILQIGKDKELDTIINGRRYRVIERTYAINPQTSGQVTLKSPVFSGEIMMPSTRRSNFLSFAETKPVSILGDDIALTILPIPETFNGDWLPSELLAIHQEWQPEPSSFRVGEPITRTITLTAAGLSEEQLPKLEMMMPAGLKVYPDQAQLHTGMNSGKLVSQKVRNFAIVASKAGEYELPEISIPWWNTVTNKYQLATIPAQKITVQKNPDIESSMPVNTPVVQSTTNAPKTITVTQASNLQWIFLALWLLTMLAWFISSRKNIPSTHIATKQQKVNQPYLQIMAACKKDKGLEVLELILPWVNSLSTTKNITTLVQALALINNQEFNQEVSKLQQCYFGKNTGQWQGLQLLSLISLINKQGINDAKQSLLRLNPQ